MRVVSGEFREPLDVADELTVNGSVSGPVHVHDGGHLIVNGYLSARDIRLGEESFVTVNGEFDGRVTSNEGLLLVAGHLAVKPATIPGRFVVAIDSMVGANMRLLPDGSLTRISQTGSQNFNPTQGVVCVWKHDEGRFQPLD
jgi:hypothetical protein